MRSARRIAASCAVGVILTGCSYNNSELHTGLSDDEIDHLLESAFAGKESDQQRVDAAADLIDVDQSQFGVFLEAGGSRLLIRIGEQDWAFFYLHLADQNVLVDFDSSGNYESFWRWSVDENPHPIRAMTDLIVFSFEGVATQFDIASRKPMLRLAQ